MDRIYTVEVRGEAREVYSIEAESADEARAIFERGDAGRPDVIEVYATEVVRVELDGVRAFTAED